MKKPFVILFILVLSATKALSVCDGNDTIYLNKVTVKEPKPLFKIFSLKIQEVSSPAITLARIPSTSVKQYGINGIVSISFNGLPSRFSNTAWEGIRLNSVMSGDYNFSVFPSIPGVSLDIHTQGINLPYNIDISMPDSEFLATTISTAYNTNLSLNKIFQTKHHKLKLTANTYYNTNRYKVINEFTYPPSQTVLKGYPSTGRFTGFSDKINISNNWHINISALYIYDKKQLVPPLFKNYSSEFMTYEIYGFKTSSTNNFGILQNKLSYSFSKQFLYYADTTKDIFSHNNSFLTNINESLSINLTKEVKATLSTEINIEKAVTSNYVSDISRTTTILTPGLVYYKNKTKLIINTGATITGSNTYYSYNTTMESKITNSTGFAVLYGKYIKLPTFNDLYWQPGGNPSLQPEILHSVTLRLKYGQKNNLSVDFTNAAVTNEIMWQPSEGSLSWQAVSIPASYRKSLAATYKATVKTKRAKLLTTNTLTYTSAKDQNGYNLMFIPKLKLSSSNKVMIKSFFVSIDYLYYGKRYISTDNSSYLPAFNLFNASVGYGYKNLKFTITVNNLTNTQYEFIQSNPMPLRYAQLTIIYMFNHKKQRL